MLDKNKYNSSCSFSEHIISYLYGEIGAPESNDFEIHLKSCSICLEELSGFDTIRSSIGEWRKEEFSVLKMPAFNFLPDQIEEIHLASVSTEKNWLITLKDKLFLPSPTWAASAFAALIICIGLAFVIFNYSKYDELAEISDVDDTTSVSPTGEIKNEPNRNSISGFIQSEKSSEKFVAGQQLKQENVSASRKIPAQRNFVTKITNELKTATNRNSSRDTNKLVPIGRKPATGKEAKQTPLSKPRNVPFLADIEDVEEKSLRLADLFDETDAK